jgi:hypothetical protein
MRLTLSTLALSTLLLLSVCKPKEANETIASDPVDSSPNKILEGEVMKIHDEVMPKINNIYVEKTRLSSKLDSVPAEKKKEIEVVILELDSAMNGMYVWMREFKPESHAETEEDGRKYLESEMNKVKKVKSDIASSLEKASQY